PRDTRCRRQSFWPELEPTAPSYGQVSSSSPWLAHCRSSLPSPQSSKPSHCQSVGSSAPLSQTNIVQSCSSLLSPQSSTPSHSQDSVMLPPLAQGTSCSCDRQREMQSSTGAATASSLVQYNASS